MKYYFWLGRHAALYQYADAAEALRTARQALDNIDEEHP